MFTLKVENEVSNYIYKIEKKVSEIIRKNWLFFSKYDVEKYKLSPDKVKGEILIYLLISKDKLLYYKLFEQHFTVDACKEKLKNLFTEQFLYRKYLKPNEQLLAIWGSKSKVLLNKKK